MGSLPNQDVLAHAQRHFSERNLILNAWLAMLTASSARLMIDAPFASLTISTKGVAVFLVTNAEQPAKLMVPSTVLPVPQAFT